MHRERLASSAVVSAGYDPATQQLEIEFRGGRVYRYRDVPRGVYDFLVRASSKGGYVNRMIEGRYSYEEISASLPEQDILGALRASLKAREEP
jgi:lysyl-tRNA synthetase class 2